MFGPAPCSFVSFPGMFFFCARVSDCESVLPLDLSGGDLLKVDVVAATANLVVVRVPALQLHAQLPHHPLQVAVPTVHQDVVLLQLLLVADDLEGGGVGGALQSVRGQRESAIGWKEAFTFSFSSCHTLRSSSNRERLSSLILLSYMSSAFSLST